MDNRATPAGEFHRVGSVEKHGKRFRVKKYRGDGSWEPAYFEREDLACAFRDTFRSQAKDRSVGSAVRDYLDYLARIGGAKGRPLKEKSIKIVRTKLEGILQLVPERVRTSNRGRKRPPVEWSDRALKSLTPNEAHRLYSERTRALKSNGKPISADTHRSELIYAQAFGAWCHAREWLTSNPFEGVLPVGELSKGKAQLDGIDEARRFIQAAYQDPHPTGGIAAAAILTLGLRANELLDRRVRDLDDNGQVLVVREYVSHTGEKHDLKSASSSRRLGLPPVIRAEINRLAQRAPGPDSYIFGEMTDGTLLKHVARLCEVAGVAKVVTHGLRGTQITLTMEIDALVKNASKSAGHSDTGVTRRHYIAAGAEQTARAYAMEEMLLSDVSEDSAEIERLEREAREAAEKLAALRAKKAEKAGITALPGKIPAGDNAANAVPNHPQTQGKLLKLVP